MGKVVQRVSKINKKELPNLKGDSKFVKWDRDLVRDNMK